MASNSLRRVIAGILVSALILTVGIGLSFLPAFYFRYRIAEDQIPSLASKLDKANEEIEEQKQVVIAARADLKQANVAAKLARTEAIQAQSNLGEETAKFRVDIERERGLTAQKQGELNRAQASAESLRDDSLAIQHALRVRNLDDALLVLRNRLEQLEAASQRSAAYYEVAKSVGAGTPEELQDRILAMRPVTPSQPWSPPSRHIATAPPVTTYPALPREVTSYMCEIPIPVVLPPTTCYVIQQP